MTKDDGRGNVNVLIRTGVGCRIGGRKKMFGGDVAMSRMSAGDERTTIEGRSPRYTFASCSHNFSSRITLFSSSLP